MPISSAPRCWPSEGDFCCCVPWTGWLEEQVALSWHWPWFTPLLISIPTLEGCHFCLILGIQGRPATLLFSSSLNFNLLESRPPIPTLRQWRQTFPKHPFSCVFLGIWVNARWGVGSLSHLWCFHQEPEQGGSHPRAVAPANPPLLQLCVARALSISLISKPVHLSGAGFTFFWCPYTWHCQPHSMPPWVSLAWVLWVDWSSHISACFCLLFFFFFYILRRLITIYFVLKTGAWNIWYKKDCTFTDPFPTHASLHCLFGILCAPCICCPPRTRA